MGIALQKVYDFVWEEFCDWYIEMVKPRLWDDGNKSQAAAIWTLKTVLIESLKLLHPFIPFVTEEIFCNLQDEEESIMVSAWPVSKKEWNFAEEEEAVEMMKEAVRAIRTVRTSMNVPPSKKATVYVVSEDAKVREIFEHNKIFFATARATMYMPFAELVDVAKEIERLEKEEKKLEGELKRSNSMLSNERFISKAPAEKIAEEKAKLEKYEATMKQVQERLAALKK